VKILSEDKKKKMYYYYGGKEKKADEIRKASDEQIAPYSSSENQRDFDRMMERFQNEFNDFWETPSRWSHDMRWRHGFPMMPFKETMMPSVDLEDRGKDFRLTVDLPGFSKENVEIEVTDDSVVIHAKKAVEEEEKKKNYIRRERAAQTFYRKIPLPKEVRSDEAKANLNEGILEITLPKKEPKETKKVKIE
jgi:HSP20 family protein